MTCMTTMMRTNQERNHPSRFLHEVSGGATCDRECQRQHSDPSTQEQHCFPPVSHYQQIVKYAKEGCLSAMTTSVRRLKLDMQNRLCRGVPAAGRQPLSQGSWTNRVGWTPDGSYREPRGQDLAFFFINGLTTAFLKAIGTVPDVRLRLTVFLKHRQKKRQ